MTVGHYIVFGEKCNKISHHFITFSVCFVLSYIVLTFLYYLFDHAVSRKCILSTKKVYLISLFLLLTFYLIEFLALYPGIFAYDAPYQLVMYLTDSISEWHPVLHTYLMGQIIEKTVFLGFDVITGIAVYTCFTVIVVAFCFSYLISLVYKKSGSLILWGLSILFLGCFPTISLQVMTASKDTYFMAFFTLAMSLTVELMTDEEVFLKSRFRIIIWILSSVLMIIFRNNCVYAVPFLFIPMIMVGRNKKQISVLILASVILFVGYKLIFVSAVAKADINGVEMLSLPSQQLVKIYRDDDSVISSEERLMIEFLIGEDGIAGFIPTTADPVKGAIDVSYYRDNKSQIKKMWLSVIAHNPGKALRAMADLTCGFWYPVCDLTFLYTGEKAYWCVYSLPPYYIAPKILPLYRLYSFFNTTDFSDGKMAPLYLLFAPALFFYIFIIMFGYCIAIHNKFFSVVFAFVLAYWCTFLFGPVALVRYTTYMFSMVPMYALIVVRPVKNIRKNGSCKTIID